MIFSPFNWFSFIKPIIAFYPTYTNYLSLPLTSHYPRETSITNFNRNDSKLPFFRSFSSSIPQMLENLDIIMRILRTKRPPNLTPKRGVFITGAVVRCPPNAEVFKWEFEPLNVFMDAIGTESVF